MAQDFQLQLEIAQLASLQAAAEAEEESLALALSASVAGYALS